MTLGGRVVGRNVGMAAYRFGHLLTRLTAGERTEPMWRRFAASPLTAV